MRAFGSAFPAVDLEAFRESAKFRDWSVIPKIGDEDMLAICCRNERLTGRDLTLLIHTGKLVAERDAANSEAKGVGIMREAIIAPVSIEGDRNAVAQSLSYERGGFISSCIVRIPFDLKRGGGSLRCRER
ncbi:hypothetical protein OEZ60_07360 [Defluviimonas sp. WL0024]|uniref:Uncharacterized protein n=1 Tax=Albidovulum salinarum TaxID=2984153 RepID=A0ABT2X4C3_9RHOB|nr:hypothetical protein [Defluviimonas sp. WL0024]MCU9847822.1 hypothetical protein [Defluviimonas sp. WL0024]